MNSFKDHYSKINKNGEFVKRRHIDSNFSNNAVNPNMKHAAVIVPKAHRANNNAVEEFEQLKRANSGTKIISSLKAKKLMSPDMFNITSGSGNLGNTGIHIAPHPQKPNTYVLTK